MSQKVSNWLIKFECVSETVVLTPDREPWNRESETGRSLTNADTRFGAIR